MRKILARFIFILAVIFLPLSIVAAIIATCLGAYYALAPLLVAGAHAISWPVGWFTAACVFGLILAWIIGVLIVALLEDKSPTFSRLWKRFEDKIEEWEKAPSKKAAKANINALRGNYDVD